MDVIDELVHEYRAALATSKGETGVFCCGITRCDGRLEMPMAAYLEFGEPRCPDCGEGLYLFRVLKNSKACGTTTQKDHH